MLDVPRQSINQPHQLAEGNRTLIVNDRHLVCPPTRHGLEPFDHRNGDDRVTERPEGAICGPPMV